MFATSSSQEIYKYFMFATIFLLGLPTITSILRRISAVRSEDTFLVWKCDTFT